MNLDFSKWPGPDLGPNCLQRFNSRRHTLKILFLAEMLLLCTFSIYHLMVNMCNWLNLFSLKLLITQIFSFYLTRFIDSIGDFSVQILNYHIQSLSCKFL